MAPVLPLPTFPGPLNAENANEGVASTCCSCVVRAASCDDDSADIPLVSRSAVTTSALPATVVLSAGISVASRTADTLMATERCEGACSAYHGVNTP